MSWLEHFEENGYAVVEDVFSADEMAQLKQEVERLIDGFDLDEHPKSLFSTYDENRHTADDYFLNSSDKIRIFFEEGAFGKDGQLLVDKHEALNKIGHGLHIKNEIFKHMTYHPKIKHILKDIKYKEPKVVQSMYIFKVVDRCPPAGQCAPLPWRVLRRRHIVHEKSTYRLLRGTSVDYRFVRTHKTDGSSLLKFEGTRPTYDQEKFVNVPVKKGSLIIIHGLVVHKSEPNTSLKSRHAYTLHVMEGENTKWSENNWMKSYQMRKSEHLAESLNVQRQPNGQTC